MATAFCSIQDRTRDKGKSLTSHPNAPAKAEAIRIALIASLHWPRSKSRGMPSIWPRSRSLKRNLPQAKVKMTVSAGARWTNSR